VWRHLQDRSLVRTGTPLGQDETDACASPVSVLSGVRGAHRIREIFLRSRLLAPCSLRVYWCAGVPNFGDQLSASVVEWAAGVPVTWVPRRYERKILGVGSILHRALAPDDCVWGSGLIRDEVISPPVGVTFLAVRGPLTRENIRADVPEVFGDPALLLPQFHAHSVEVRYSVGIVPHYVDYAVVDNDDPSVCVVDVTRSWEDVVDEIRSCELIVSSSLHGVIVAEAYGIPAVWVRISDGVIGGSFKFHDYLLATGRDPAPPIEWEQGLAEAVRSPLPPMEFDAEPLLASAKRLRETLPSFCEKLSTRTAP